MDAFEPRPDWARRLLGQGEAPDPRFTLANERTFLAWIRTALALLGGGIAIETFAGQALQAPLRLWLVGSLMLLSMLLSAGACLRWLQVERALRQLRPLPLPALVPLLALGCLIAALMAAVVLWPRWHA
ncbi:YidH family protein [Pseudomonas sp. KCJK8751]|uniref:YidH family protein n=1 Tax=Pseudomonas sp. KCJK8751 TaxID=3344564 RepID=UPI003906BB6A